MSKRAVAVIMVAVLALVGGPIAAIIGYGVHVHNQRVHEANQAFDTLVPLRMGVLYNPIPFNRYCCYLIEFSRETLLSDENVHQLDSLNNLATKNEVDLIIETEQITDLALPALKRIRVLDRLDVTKTRISDEGIAELIEALPQTRVHDRPTAAADGGQSPAASTESTGLLVDPP
jgi:hypothetical protein